MTQKVPKLPPYWSFPYALAEPSGHWSGLSGLQLPWLFLRDSNSYTLQYSEGTVLAWQLSRQRIVVERRLQSSFDDVVGPKTILFCFDFIMIVRENRAVSWVTTRTKIVQWQIYNTKDMVYSLFYCKFGDVFLSPLPKYYWHPTYLNALLSTQLAYIEVVED